MIDSPSARRLVGLGVLVLVVAGCDANPAVPGGAGFGPAAEEDGPFGPPESSRLLAPFAGAWRFDVEKTLETERATGISDDQIAQQRKLYSDHPEFAAMADMTVTGNEFLAGGNSEYRLFGMHEHDGKICGKAWHHEDRYDPGDMSKCYVRLKIIDDRLYFEMRMKDGLPDLNDPELLGSPLPAEGGSSATCDADSPPGADWDRWTTSVFVRKQ